jgi:hypothetical protein
LPFLEQVARIGDGFNGILNILPPPFRKSQRPLSLHYPNPPSDFKIMGFIRF